jgi:hypothetical protein
LWRAFRFYRAPRPCTKLRPPSFGLPQAMIWYVNSNIDSDASDGRTLQTAFKTLQHAVDVAKAGDTILIAPGAYDQDLPARVGTARAANIVVTVAGSE